MVLMRLCCLRLLQLYRLERFPEAIALYDELISKNPVCALLHCFHTPGFAPPLLFLLLFWGDWSGEGAGG